MPAPRSLRVLLVEDDPATHTALRAILAHRGYEVTVAVTVAEALRQFEAGMTPDCVVLDLMLPDGNGLTLLEAIRVRNLSTRVVVTTGISEPEMLQDAARLQPTALLRKPINLAELLRVLQIPERRGN